jgi:hypothetical protein
VSAVRVWLGQDRLRSVLASGARRRLRKIDLSSPERIGVDAQWWWDNCAPITPPALGEWSRLSMQSDVRFPGSWRIDTPRGAVARLLATSDKPFYENFSVIAGVSHPKDRNRLKKNINGKSWGSRAPRAE